MPKKVCYNENRAPGIRKNRERKMLNIAVLDDEAAYIDRICRITETCMEWMGMEYKIHVYEKGRDVLDELKRGVCFDIYLLDIQLPDVDGLETAKQIRRSFSEPILIYITNYVNYAVEAYEVNTYRYIPKQMLEEKLPQAYCSMEPLLKKNRKHDRFYLIRWYSFQEKIFYRDIFYLKKEGKYVVFVHKNGESRTRKSLEEVLEELQSKEFLMIDRSCAVNMGQVQSVKDRRVYIQNGENFPVSQAKWQSVMNAFMNGGL